MLIELVCNPWTRGLLAGLSQHPVRPYVLTAIRFVVTEETGSFQHGV
jgi:hypothetical protein